MSLTTSPRDGGSTPLTIAFVCSEYPPGPHGGIGTLIQLLARNLARAGHSVRVVGIYPVSYPAPDREVDDGVEVYRLRETTDRFGWIPARLRLFRLLSRWSKSGQIDLIEVPDYRGSAAGWPSLRVPVIVRCSGTASYFAAEMGQALSRAFYVDRASLRRADFWCSESRYLAEKTRQLYKLKSPPDAILYNPVSVPTAPDVVRSALRVVFAGTLTEKKGVLSLVQAWPSVLARCPRAELHIWGKDTTTRDGGSVQSSIESRLGSVEARTVHFHGHIPLDDLLAQFHTARVAALPSFAEGFALTPLHAMAAGCPTIYTTRGSGPELIEHRRTGLLVEPARPDEIANAIVQVLRDDELAARLGANGRRHIEEFFSLDRLIPENTAFYEECLKRWRVKGGGWRVASGGWRVAGNG